MVSEPGSCIGVTCRPYSGFTGFGGTGVLWFCAVLSRVGSCNDPSPTSKAELFCHHGDPPHTCILLISEPLFAVVKS